MITITINGQTKKVLKGVTILQALYENNIEVPRFCYHEGLQIAGNCRMCLIEVEKVMKPVAACATAALEGMVIKTETDVVKKAREGVMELLLVNHPLDCPICDQGGECDLQDQAMLFGNDRGRTIDSKRSVEDKNLGPLIKTVMTRCIHCTRCVRYVTETIGMNVLGTTSRGNKMEIGTFLEKALLHELSGNVIDLCPVGALTSKPYAFTARSWELISTESIDIFDGLGSHIRIDTRATEVMRIQPKIQKGLNSEWISDKIRFCYDGLKYQRITRPAQKIGQNWVNMTWKEALQFCNTAIQKTNNFEISCGELIDAETMFTAKLLNNSQKVVDGTDTINYDFRSKALNLEKLKEAKNILFVNINPRQDASVLNITLRQLVNRNKANVFVFGTRNNLTYDYQQLGNSNDCQKLIEGRHPLSQIIFKKKGMIVFLAQHGSKFQEELEKIKELVSEKDWYFNNLFTNSNLPTRLELGISSKKEIFKKNRKVIEYFIGTEPKESSKKHNTVFTIYQGHHGYDKKNTKNVNLILPSCSFVEKSGLYVNNEGKVQEAKKAVDVKGLLRQDWEIIKAISSMTKHKTLTIKTQGDLRSNMILQNPQFVGF